MSLKSLLSFSETHTQHRNFSKDKNDKLCDKLPGSCLLTLPSSHVCLNYLTSLNLTCNICKIKIHLYKKRQCIVTFCSKIYYFNLMLPIIPIICHWNMEQYIVVDIIFLIGNWYLPKSSLSPTSHECATLPPPLLLHLYLSVPLSFWERSCVLLYTEEFLE